MTLEKNNQWGEKLDIKAPENILECKGLLLCEWGLGWHLLQAFLSFSGTWSIACEPRRLYWKSHHDWVQSLEEQARGCNLGAFDSRVMDPENYGSPHPYLMLVSEHSPLGSAGRKIWKATGLWENSNWATAPLVWKDPKPRLQQATLALQFQLTRGWLSRPVMSTWPSPPGDP